MTSHLIISPTVLEPEHDHLNPPNISLTVCMRTGSTFGFTSLNYIHLTIQFTIDYAFDYIQICCQIVKCTLSDI